MSVFDDAVFYWLPGDAVTASSDTVSGDSALGGLTEGTAVTVSTRPGRTYSGNQGSRFDLGLVDPFPADMTFMAVWRTPTGTDVKALYHGDSTETAKYNRFLADYSSNIDFQVRNTNSAGPKVIVGWTADEDFHVSIGTVSEGAVNADVEFWFDGVSQGTDSFAKGTDYTPDRITVGRMDDSSPGNSTGGQVFRAYVWDRVLNSSEIAEATANPFDESPPDAPTNPAAAALGDTSIRVTWDNVADETGYRVERSPNGTTGWADVSGNLAADTVTYDDTGLTASTQYFYRVYAFNANGDSDPSTTVNATTTGGGSNRIGGDRAIRRSPR